MLNFLRKHFLLIILCAIVLWGFVLRVYDLGKPSMWIDEGYTLNAVQATLETGYPILPSGEFYTNGMLENYVVAGFVALFGIDPFSPWSARLPSVFFGAGLIIVVYLLAREMFNDERLALLAAALTSFSSWEIAWSRQVRGYAMLSFFLVLAFILLLKFNRKGSVRDAVGSLAFLILACLSHGVAFAFIPAFLVIFFAPYVAKTSFFRWGVESATLILGIVTVGLTPVVCLIFSVPFHSRPSYYDFFFAFIGLFTYGFIASVAFSLFKKNKKNLASLWVSVVVSVFIIIFYAPTGQFRYILPLFPMMVIALAYSAVQLVGLLGNTRPSKYWFVLVVATLFALGYSHFSFIPQSNYVLEKGSPQPDFKGAFLYIEKNRGVDDVIISPYAQLQYLYAGQKGFWLAMNLTGKQGEVERKSKTGVDYYVGAPIIKNLAELKKIMSDTHGFIVLDMMAFTRLPSITGFLLDNPHVETVFDSGSKDKNRIKVFRF